MAVQSSVDLADVVVSPPFGGNVLLWVPGRAVVRIEVPGSALRLPRGIEQDAMAHTHRPVERLHEVGLFAGKVGGQRAAFGEKVLAGDAGSETVKRLIDPVFVGLLVLNLEVSTAG